MQLSRSGTSASRLPLHHAHPPGSAVSTNLINCSIHAITCITTSIFEHPRDIKSMAGRGISELYPARFLAESAHPEKTSNPPDLLILNQPIAHFTAFLRLWKHTGFRICADGGANRLFDMLKDDLIQQREQYVSRIVVFNVNISC